MTHNLILFVEEDGELVTLEACVTNVPENGLKEAVSNFASENDLNVIGYQDRESN